MTALAPPFNRFALGHFADADGAVFLGVVRAQSVRRAGSLGIAGITDATHLRDLLEDWDTAFAVLSDAIVRQSGADTIELSDLRSLAPLPDARQVFCAGANYGRHVVEMSTVMPHPDTVGMTVDEKRRYGHALVERQRASGRPYIFMKPASAIAGPDDDLALPDFSERLDWEIELAAVFGRAAYRVARADAMAHVAGYMIANDITARDRVQRSDPGAFGPDWVGAKGAPGFLPTGPLFVPAAFVPDPHDLAMRLWINGVLMQDDRTSDMTFGIDVQIADLSERTRLLPGDLLCTGSPAGNGIARGIFLKPDDLIEAEIEGLGRQRTRCIAQSVA